MELESSAQKILNRKILLLDGGLGTTLENEHNVKFTSAETPLWSSHLLISSPETLLKVQTDFVKAGADIILTATYQASYGGIAKTPAVSHWYDMNQTCHPPAEAKALLTSAVSISKTAVQKLGLIALSLGAYGATLIPSQEYTGDYGSDAKLLEFHQNRLDAFIHDEIAWKDINIIAFETLPRLDEVLVVREVMRNVQSRADDRMIKRERNFDMKPYWISCVFPNDDDLLPDGSTIEEMIKAMCSENVSSTPLPYAIGMNCTKVCKIARLVKKFERAADKLGLMLPRLVIYPDNAGGLVYDTAAQKWVGEGSEEASWDEQVCEIVKEVHERGRWTGVIVGGCCKTTPAHIAKLKKRLDDWGR